MDVPNFHEQMHYAVVNTNATRIDVNRQPTQVDHNTPSGIQLWQRNGDAALDMYIYM